MNIAEGSERFSDKDFSRFLNNALASLNEVVAGLDASFDDKYITKQERDDFLARAENIYRQLKAFSSKVRNDSESKFISS